jgi:signal transduction histidine kinase
MAKTEYTHDNDNTNTHGNTVRPLYVDCDPQKIAQVIFNLLDNAMKFTFDGQILVSTAIKNDGHPQSPQSPPSSDSASTNHHGAGSPNTNTIAGAADANFTSRYIKTNTNNNIVKSNIYGQTSRLLVTVQDTGTGISPQIKNQLFEKFATKSRQGTGLGLYLSKKIVESHGGSIWHEESLEEKDILFNDNLFNVGSNQKIGTVFKFEIPMSISKKNIYNLKQ